ncbi:hypothetical protein DPSP01_003847 [Paraphaeosphaeria sporulosa]|uniref:BZIP transcription factor n=1 Tax=Paraphaeosphaeria sporulosa TaxID=1460663 RepID=A0A177C721_9PLEO|nr:uncharacterized protein CC84DRAFT_1166709 [Paraphaeosphaeria sporulosa]OAG02921.1 hypothetical protein CC84DRAFT_1166709 [Paraphaeosphaeria sporulosa]
MAGDAHSPADDGPADHTDGSASQPPAKKRRTGTSSRGVANLTPEQLARKRANDREAQRAIRERTKNQIDTLHRRIQDLESQQPYHDLQLVLREKDQVAAELHEVRKRLESIVAIASPALRGPNGLSELAAAATRSPLPAPPPHPRALHAKLGDIAAASPQNGAQSPGAAEGARHWGYAGEHPPNHDRHWDGAQYHHERGSHGTPEMPFDQMPFDNDKRMGVNFLLENNGQSQNLDPSLPPPPPVTITTTSLGSGLGHHAPILVPHLTLPRNVPTTCPLDAILLDFLTDRQGRAAQGDHIKTIVGPMYPNFTPIVHPERNVDAHPLSKLFTDILRTFPDICGLPEQVAIVYIMFLVMRWQIEPSAENYDRLPDWVTPRASQLFVPHPVWNDHLPWPKLRDRLINSPTPVPFDAFFIPFTTTVSLNWPYEPRDCLLPASKLHPSSLSATSSIPASSPYSTAVNAGSPAGPHTPHTISTPGVPKEDEDWLINPAFESHLRNLNNWSLGPAFRSVFPAFGDAVRIKEGR